MEESLFIDKEQMKTLKKAVENLHSKKLHERTAARSYLDGLGEQKFDLLLQFLKEEGANRRKCRRNAIIGISFYIGFILLMIVIPPMFGAKPQTTMLGQIGSMTAVMAGAMAATTAQKNGTRILAEFDDKRAVGPLSLALEFNDVEVVAVAREKLVRLLPQLKASDAQLLDEEQRSILYKALHSKKHYAALRIAILNALQQVGDEKGLPHVQKLAKGEGLTAQEEDILRAAQECLPYLERRVDRLRASQTLLRASSASEAMTSSPDMLLRPAMDVGATPSEELLRASDGQETETYSRLIAEEEAQEEKVMRHGR